MEHESDGGIYCNWCVRNNPQRIDQGTWRLRNKRTSGDHLDYTIIKIGQNTKKSSGDLRRLHHHHHHIVLAARISLTISRHSSLSSIALGRSSGQQPVSSHSCWMYIRAGRPAFARPCVGIHKSTSLMSSSLLLQQCPACLVCLRRLAVTQTQANADIDFK